MFVMIKVLRMISFFINFSKIFISESVNWQDAPVLKTILYYKDRCCIIYVRTVPSVGANATIVIHFLPIVDSFHFCN